MSPCGTSPPLALRLPPGSASEDLYDHPPCARDAKKLEGGEGDRFEGSLPGAGMTGSDYPGG